jgi:hypothetical protein
MIKTHVGRILMKPWKRARTRRLTEGQIIAIIDELGDLITAPDAEPEHKLEVYRNLGSYPRTDLNPSYMVAIRAELYSDDRPSGDGGIPHPALLDVSTNRFSGSPSRGRVGGLLSLAAAAMLGPAAVETSCCVLSCRGTMAERIRHRPTLRSLQWFRKSSGRG